MALQADPIKLTLKAPEIKQLKLHSDEPPSDFAFSFNVRRYTEELEEHHPDVNLGCAKCRQVWRGCTTCQTKARYMTVCSRCTSTHARAPTSFQ